MPPVIGVLVATAIGGITGAVVGAVVSTVLSVAMSFAIGALTNKPKQTAPNSSNLLQDARGRTIMVRSSIEPHRVIYGETVVSGPLLYVDTSGSGGSILDMVIALAGHEVASIGDVWLNDSPSTDAKFSPGGVTKCAITKYTGETTQSADAGLVARHPAVWTTAHRLRGIAYLILSLTWDQDIWLSGMPNVKAQLCGRKVYDPRDGTTAYSTNPALCQLDYLMADFGMGVPAEKIDMDSVVAAANVCAETVTLADGGTQRRYHCNGSFQLDQRPIDVMEDLLSCSSGTLVYTQGKYRLYAGAYDAPTHALTEDDLRGDITYTARPARRDLFNSVRGVFVDPTNYWQPIEFPAVTSAAYEAEDGGQLSTDIQLPYTVNRVAAQRLAKIYLQRHRQAGTALVPAKLTALPIAPWETVSVSIASLGWTNKVMRVLKSTITEDLGVDLTLQEESPLVYAWTAAEETAVPLAPVTDLPDAWTVAAPTGFVAQSGGPIRVVAGGSTINQILLTWMISSNPYVTSGGYVNCDYKLSSDSTWSPIGPLGGNSTQVYISPVTDGEKYDLRIAFSNTIGKQSAWTEILTHTAGGTERQTALALAAIEVPTGAVSAARR